MIFALRLRGCAHSTAAGTGNYVEVADADHGTFADFLAAGNSALATLPNTSAYTTVTAVVSDVTDADEEALSAHVFIYTDSDEMMILSATIAASDFIA